MPHVPLMLGVHQTGSGKIRFLHGAMIAADRLMRCGRDEMKTAPLILVNGKWKYYDPLDQNTCWWARDRSDPSPITMGNILGRRPKNTEKSVERR